MADVKDYPRYVTPEFIPFSPVELAEKTEAIVGLGDQRKYTNFYCTGVYGGISTAYTVGCCLRCIFCWVDWSRDFPEKYGFFCSPEKVSTYLLLNARRSKVKKLRISGGEPTLLFHHLLKILVLLREEDYLFILETNGILLGENEDLVKELVPFPNLYVRVSIKAGTPSSFEKKTGAKKDYFYLPFQCIENLKKHGLNFHVAVMSDKRLMSVEEKRYFLKELKKTGYHGFLEEERCEPYPHSVARLRFAGWE
ncbi:MAG TPA: radical SAM protein [bacterium]|nr:radical SAM protein [bacterium]HEX67660.1 radical SAM protein [bacterium]